MVDDSVAIRNELFHLACGLVALNATLTGELARLEGREQAIFKKEQKWQGQVKEDMVSFSSPMTANLSLDGSAEPSVLPSNVHHPFQLRERLTFLHATLPVSCFHFRPYIHHFRLSICYLPQDC